MNTRRHPKTRRHLRALGVLGAVALLSLTAACGGASDKSSAAPGRPLSGEGIGPGGVPQTSDFKPTPCHSDATAATWPGELPAPGSAMPGGSTMAKIQQRGFLIAGIDMSTWLFGYDPTHSNVPQGFDVDIAKEIAKAVFGDADSSHIQFKVVTLADPVTGEARQLNDGNVDVVVRTTTITCRRLQDPTIALNFSNPYYTAQQRLLMPIGPDGKAQSLGLSDLKGRKVCATKNSTALETIKKRAGEDAAFPAPNALDCLVYLQQGKVAGVFTDDAILRGMEAQDPKVKITTAPGSDDDNQPYGIATAKDAKDFAKFVNGVLAKILKPGSAGTGGTTSQWAALFANDLHADPGSTPKIPSDYPLG